MSTLDMAREELASKDVAERAAAVRSVGALGDWGDAAALLALATDDRSPSVRLYAAAALTGLTYRLRRDGGVPAAAEAEALDALKAWNPQLNPPLLMWLGAVGTPRLRSRLGRLLRDPHSDVRMAATTAIRRAALSDLAVDEPAWGREALGWVTGGRLPPDAQIDLVRLAGQAGWSGWHDVLLAAIGRGGPLAEAAREALSRLQARDEAATWSGLWSAGGGDVHEEEEATDDRFLLVADDQAYDGASTDALTPGPDGVSLAGRGPARLVWARPVKGDAERLALQVGGVTWWKAEDKGLAKEVEARHEALAGFPAGCAVLAAALDGVEGAVAPRARALATWHAGDPAAAAEQLDALLAAKKPKVELHWYRANVALALGHLDDARTQAERAVAGAAKRAPWRAEAEALLASLTP